MKKVICGKELQTKMLEAINILSEPVMQTLGPKGSNVIIDHSNFSPFITNDGVTIASSISSDDAVINTIIELAKESSLKTNEEVGDGTTTTIVIMQNLFKNGLKLINNGVNPIVLKKELDNCGIKIKNEIQKYSRKPNKKDLINIASVSSNDIEIGKLISDVFTKVKKRESIVIKEGDNIETEINYLDGYIFDANLASVYFLKSLKEIKIDNPYVLIIDNILNDIENISQYINKVLTERKPLIIMAEDIIDNVVNEIVTINKEYDTNIILLKTPEYGLRKEQILEDLSIISDTKIIRNYEDNITLGTINSAIIRDDICIFKFKVNNKIHEYVEKLKSNLNVSIDKDFMEKRIAMFNYGMADILVGGKTETERREAKMRFDDALWAISIAKKGIIPGSGLILSKISAELKIENAGDELIKGALKKPMEQILKNAGEDYEEIMKNIELNEYKCIYNVKKQIYEDVDKTTIIDPTDVVVNAILNAISIAGMLLTTSSLVINESPSNLNCEKEYNEL